MSTEQTLTHHLQAISQGIEQIVLVTHGYHMPRAQRNFERAIASANGTPRIKLVAAPMGMPSGGRQHFGNWLPSVEGHEFCWIALHEWLGMLVGA